MSETKEIKAKLEGLTEGTTGDKKPFLKLKVGGRSYNYFAPFEVNTLEDITAHIAETKAGLKPFMDEEISFEYVEKEAPGRDYPYKNIRKFLVDFKTAGDDKGKKPAKTEQKKIPKPPESKEEAGPKSNIRRRITLMVGLAKTINLGDYSTVRPEFRIEEEIEGTIEDIEKLKDEWLDTFRLWIDAEESKHR
jgi:hypothetical protein